MIELHGVSKVFDGDILALRQIQLNIAQGEFVLLSGPSGAGKSTLLSLLTLEDQASQGRLIIDGTDVGRLKARQVSELRRRMGIIFQDFKLLYDRSAYENVAFALRILGLPEPEIRRETHAALERTGLGAKAHLKPHKLSGGEQQRVAVARALVHDPGLILADEPTGNLDPETGWEIFRLLLQANERGATVVVATHNQAMLSGLGKRVVRLRDGLVESDGPWQGPGLDEQLPLAKPRLDGREGLSGGAPA